MHCSELLVLVLTSDVDAVLEELLRVAEELLHDGRVAGHQRDRLLHALLPHCARTG